MKHLPILPSKSVCCKAILTPIAKDTYACNTCNETYLYRNTRKKPLEVLPEIQETTSKDTQIQRNGDINTEGTNPNGRPSDYNDEITATICERIARGESLIAICETDGMPTPVTVRNWLGKHKKFLSLYARAREEQADNIFDECQEIADEVGEYNEGIQKARLRIDVRKWRASKLRPKKYGDRLEIEQKGNLNLNFQQMTDEQLRQIAQQDE